MKIRLMQSLALASLLLIAPLALAADRATESFREEHAEVKVHLQHLHDMSGSMAGSDSDAQRKTAKFVAKFLTEHILTHATWEEQHLYPAVDKRTHTGEYAFTTSMRYEHRIVGREIAELNELAAGDALDAVAFARKTDRLLGLISAHFEEEEEVLLPILDKATTREALEKELEMGGHAKHH